MEIWLVDLEPAVSTMASFDSVQTIEEHCLYLMKRLNHWIAMDPALVRTHYLRADCALLAGLLVVKMFPYRHNRSTRPLAALRFVRVLCARMEILKSQLLQLLRSREDGDV
jgi:hypothetical protein